jgi:hypothetical protein
VWSFICAGLDDPPHAPNSHLHLRSPQCRSPVGLQPQLR